eukprot:1764252-Rhodomonas_salina.1
MAGSEHGDRAEAMARMLTGERVVDAGPSAALMADSEAEGAAGEKMRSVRAEVYDDKEEAAGKTARKLCFTVTTSGSDTEGPDEDDAAGSFAMDHEDVAQRAPPITRSDAELDTSLNKILKVSCPCLRNRNTTRGTDKGSQEFLSELPPSKEFSPRRPSSQRRLRSSYRW